jgi:hypothetical protein
VATVAELEAILARQRATPAEELEAADAREAEEEPLFDEGGDRGRSVAILVELLEALEIEDPALRERAREVVAASAPASAP